jgi:phage replication-related protein YjqB (UPF0714/DUF867 family)
LCDLRAKFITDLTSEIAIAGKKRINKKNKVKNKPKLPIKVEISTQVGEYMAHEEGRKSR